MFDGNIHVLETILDDIEATILYPLLSGIVMFALLELIYICITIILVTRRGQRISDLFVFERDKAEEEIRRIELISGRYEEMLREECLDMVIGGQRTANQRVKLEQHKDQTQLLKLSMNHVFPHSKKKVSSRRTYIHKKGSQSNLKNELMPALKLIGCFIIMIVMLSLRYYIIRNRTSDTIYLCRSMSSFIQLYWNSHVVQTTMSEVVLYDRHTTIDYKDPVDFFKESKERLEKKIFPAIDKLLTYSSSMKSAQILHQIADKSPFCDILQGTAENGHLYMNCESAMSGICNLKIREFYMNYVQITDQFLTEWGMMKNIEDKRSLLKLDRYSSFLTYSVYNQFGTMDALYYEFLIPLTTELASQKLRIVPIVNLLNIVSVSFCIVYIILIVPLLYWWAKDIMNRLEEILTSIPIRLIEYNPYLLALLKKMNNSKLPHMFWL